MDRPHDRIPGHLSQILVRAAEDHPGAVIGFIRANRSIRTITYPELLDSATRILGGLRKSGIAAGDHVILSLDTSEEIIPALWACFLGGIVPALLQPPVSFSEHNPAAEKAARVYRLLGSPKVILSHAHVEGWLNGGIPSDSLIDYGKLPLERTGLVQSGVAGDDLALLQFSSGSTGDPKGVMLTHRNILINIHDISRGLRLMPEDVSVSWMPLFHDMGLMGFHMTATYIGCHQYFIDTVDFIKNPLLWLDAMSELKATITGCPNFGQVLVNRAIGRKKDPSWDLSPLRAVFNGAEPISVACMEEFNGNLRPFGYRDSAMLPAYGMAEATLAVSFTDLDLPARITFFERESLLGKGLAAETPEQGSSAMPLVSVGIPLPSCEVVIRDDAGNEMPSGHAGHILVRGSNVTPGYFNNPEETGESLREGWLYTGDLGFIHDGELYILGRLKDIIFINGINYYAHDLERIALQMEEVTFGKVAIAGYFDEEEGKDKILVFLVASDNEVSRALFQKIRKHFRTTLGLLLDTFIPIRSNEIPRTSSGKIQRYKLVNRFLRGEFTAVTRF